MLRSVLLAVGGAILVIAAALLIAGSVWTVAVPLAVPLGVIGVLIVGGLVLERYRYRATTDVPPNEPGWEMLSERFVDPATDELIVVWYNRRSGKRLYVRSGPV